MPKSEEESSQLGGDLLVDREGSILYLYRSERSDDRPSMDALADALGKPPKFKSRM